MKLFYSPGACSLSPHIVLRETGLPHELVRVDLRAKKTADGGDYWAINPAGSVPTLQLDSGETLTEGPAIVQYLGDLAPQSGIVPAAGTMARYRLIEALNFISTELHKSYSPLFRPNTPDDYKPVARETLVARYGVVEKMLAGKSYLLGETFTAADAYLFVVTRWSFPLKLDLSQYSNLAAFMARVGARPKVKEAIAAEA
jgi:glutathione S-transferase